MPEWKDDDLLTAQQFATYLQVSQRRLRELIMERRVPLPLKLAGTTRWKWQTIREWVAAIETLQRLGIDLKPDDENRRDAAESGDLRRFAAEEQNTDCDKPKKR